jgi:NAD(P)-dependent dehydrogenase (short-subunit alcohol dehydrogenase family)
MARGEDRLRATADELRPDSGQPDQHLDWIAGDVSHPVDCAAVVARYVESFDPSAPLILVNNAGIYGPMGDTASVPWDDWVRAIEINLFGTLLMSRAVLPQMRTRGRGKIINLSGGGATAPLPRISAYAASKTAVVRLTETMAEELRNEGIDINAIAPGALNTRLLDEVLEAGPAAVGQAFYDRALEQREKGGAPLERGASLAVFLASTKSDGITGRLLSAVWDDWENLPAQREALEEGDVYTLRRVVPADR